MTSSEADGLLADKYHETFGGAPQVMARVPGRVEFIGNHTDYNGRAVLGAAIDRFVWVAASPNACGRLRLASSSVGYILELPGDGSTQVQGSDSWANYPLGAWQTLHDSGLRRPPAFDLYIHSDLPAGAGLTFKHLGPVIGI